MSIDPKALLFDIQGFSVHDGPGCRTLIFLKGCPLHCRWCSNPEGISPYRNIMYYKEKCIKDLACLEACPSGAISLDKDGEGISIERAKCQACKDYPCVDACDYDALRISGFYMTADELMRIINRDRNYYGTEGGITISGGEPLMQLGFTKEILKRCQETYIHTAIETSGYVPWDYYEDILNYVEWIFYDLKSMDSDLHKRETGVANDLILKNAEKLAFKSNHYRLIFRIPLISGINDSYENLEETARFIKSIGKKEINILPLHHLGSSKYELLGLNYGASDLSFPDHDRLQEVKILFKSQSIECHIGANTPF